MELEKELLEKALNSILHGSTQIVSTTDSYGNVQNQEVRINDLRTPLINKLAEKLVQTEGFKNALEKAFTGEVIKKIQEKVLDKMGYSDLPYDVRQKIERQIKEAELVVRKYKIVAEVVDSEEIK